MSIPIISEEALKEACSLIASRKIFGMDNKETHDYLLKYNDELRDKQPALYAFLQRTLKFHIDEMGGKAIATTIPLFCSIVVNAMYIQSEIDDIGDIFKDFK